MPGADAPLRLRSHWPAAAMALLAGLIAVWAYHHMFPALSWNRDEPVYLWHMELLREGQLTATDGGHPDLFLPWLSAQRDGSLFTQYTLGWPLVLLAARTLTGTAAAALPAGAALAVVGTYSLAYELSQRRRVAVLAGGLLVGSPIIAVQGGVYLSYLFTLGIGLLAGALLHSGVRRARPWRHLWAGLLLGWIFLTRPYDALLWGGAFALGLLITEASRRRDVVRALGLAVGAALPLVALTLLYNRHVTGELLTFPITVADPLDGFGFGTRRLMPSFDTVDYTLAKALRSTAKNGFVLPWFLAGSYLTVLVALIGLWRQRHDAVARVMLLVAAVFPIGYFVFWGTYLSSLASRISGPIYFVPLYAVVCILAAGALDRWWAERPGLAKRALVLLAVATVPGAVTRFDANRDVSVRQEPWRDSVAALPDDSIVFVQDTGPYLLYINPFSTNPPDLDGDPLYAAAGSPSMLDLIAEHPDRTPFLQEASIPAPELGPREDPYDLDVAVAPILVQRGAVLDLTITLTPPEGMDVVDVTVSTDHDRLRRTLRVAGASASFDVPLGGSAPGALVTGDRGRITVSAGWGRTEEDARRLSVVRRVTPYRMDGDTLEVLTPATAQINILLGEERREWRHVIGLNELVLSVTPAG